MNRRHRPSLARLYPITFTTFILVLSPILSAQPAFSRDAGLLADRPEANRLLIKVRQQGSLPEIARIHRSRGHREVKRYSRFDRLHLVELGPNSSARAEAAVYAANPFIEYAEPDIQVRIRSGRLEPNDPLFPQQWAQDNSGQAGGTPGSDVDGPEAWAIRTGAPNVVIAIVDTGLRLTHEDLALNLWTNPAEASGLDGLDDDQNGYIDDVHGINAVTGSGDPTDDNGHGTHVAGIAAAVGGNGLGVAGVVWQGKLMALKAFDANGFASVSDILTCLEYASNHGASIINASWGFGHYSQSLLDALTSLRDDGIVMVAAAGNTAADEDIDFTYPSAYDVDNLVSVTATRSDDSLAVFGSYGMQSIDLAAPGEAILSTGHGHDAEYVLKSGSSMAAPHVSGAIALLMEALPDETYLPVIYRLLAGTDRLSSLKNKVLTGGRLNLGNLMVAVERGIPINDDFANRTEIFGDRVTAFGGNTGATSEEGEPNSGGAGGGRSVWWEWTAPRTGTVEVTTSGSTRLVWGDLDTVLAVYSGSDLKTLIEEAFNDNGQTSFDGNDTSRVLVNVVAGAKYQILVDSRKRKKNRAPLTGEIRLNLAYSPANDHFSSAFPLGGDRIHAVGSNAGASVEKNEPGHAGTTSGRSVWWSWTAPMDGTVTWTTARSNFDTVLAVYTGNRLGKRLSAVVSNDDEPQGSLGGTTSEVSFAASAGTTYHVAVDGVAGRFGRIVLAGGYRAVIDDLGVLPGAVSGFAYGINDLGHVTGESDSRAVLWRDGSIRDLQTLGNGSTARAFHLNNAGVVVGESRYSPVIGTSSLAFAWDPITETMSALAEETIGSYAIAINESGTVAGSRWMFPNGTVVWPRAVRWTANDGFTDLGTLGGFSSWGSGINERGEIVGRADLSGAFPFHAFVHRPDPGGEGVMVDLGTLGGRVSGANAINDAGDVVGASERTGGNLNVDGHAFLWRDGLMHDLGALEGDNSTAFAVNNAGFVVGESPVQVRPFLWHRGVMIDLNRLIDPQSGWELESARGLNDYGEIVGWGIHPEGHRRPWRLRPPTPIRLISPQVTASGSFEFEAVGPDGLTCEVDASGDLRTWSQIGSFSLNSGYALVEDPVADQFSIRFYRVRSGSMRSVNAVGFQKSVLPGGLSYISNPFLAVDNRVSALLPDAPVGTTLFKWDPALAEFRSNTFVNGWSDPWMTLTAGEGTEIQLPSPFLLIMSGEVGQDFLANRLPATQGMVSSLVPIGGALDSDLGFPVANGDRFCLLEGGACTPYEYVNGGWVPDVPSVAVGESFWVLASSAPKWVRYGSVWP